MRTPLTLAITLWIGLLSGPLQAEEDPLQARLDQLIRQLASRDFGKRERADKALRQVIKQLVDTLRKGAGSKDLEVRQRCRNLLATLNRTSKTPGMVVRQWLIGLGRVNAYDRGMRREIRQTLAKAGEEGREAVIDVMVDPRVSDETRSRIRSIMFVMKDKPFGQHRLTTALRSENRSVRRHSAFILGVLRYKEAVPGLLERIPLSDGVELNAVMQSLAVLGDPKKTPERIRALIKDRKLDYYDRSYIALALLYLRDPHGGDLMVRMLEDTEYKARQKAWDVLGPIVPPEAGLAFTAGHDRQERAAQVEKIKQWWSRAREDMDGRWLSVRRGRMLHVFLRNR